MDQRAASMAVGLVATASILLGLPLGTSPGSAAGGATKAVAGEASASLGPFGPDIPPLGPGPTGARTPSAIIPGAIHHASASVEVGYDVDVWVGSTRRVRATLRLDVHNVSGEPMDRLAMTTAARVPLEVTAATVDGQPVTASVGPSRVTVGLGGVLPDGASATI